jgi:multiple sugar transport system substrate-binding protein
MDGGRARAGALALVVTTLAAACSASPTATPSSASSATATTSAPVTLHLEDFSSEQIAFHKQVAAEYHRLNPSVTIDWQSIAQAQYLQTLPLAFQSKQSPDIFYWSQAGTNNMAQLLANGWIQPLVPNGSPPKEWMDRWPAGSFENGINMRDGKVYGFPWQDTSTWGPGYMYLNNAVFKAAGLDVTKPPQTWSDLRSACSAVKTKTGKYCLAVPMKGVDFQRLWFALAAGAMTDLFFDYRTGHYDIAEAPLQRTFEYIQGLYKDGFIAPGVQDKSFSRQQLAAGQAAIYMDGPWMISVWDQLGFHSDSYTVAPHPVPDGGATGALSQRNNQNVYWLSSQTAHPAEAWAFIQWMTDPNGYFVERFLKGSFATLAFANNKKFLTDPAWQSVFRISGTKAFRVRTPEPVLKCPDLAKSTAEVEANRVHPDWEYEVMVSALVNGTPLGPAAQQVVDTRQKALEQQLQKENAGGLKVSTDCYTFPTWQYTQDFDPSGYPKG